MKMIISEDLHLREDKPRCRIDSDWIQTQENALNQLAEICIARNADLFLTGDIFHRATEYRMVIYIQRLAEKLSKSGLSIYYLCGNHDMLYHSSSNLDKSAIGLLRNSFNCFSIKDYFDKLDFNSGEKVLFSAGSFDEKDYVNAKFVFKHVLVFPDVKSIPPNCDAITAKELLEEFPKAEWIFTGDYHHNFHYEKNGRHVINSGCLLRQASDFKDYQCGVFYVDTEKNICEFIPIIDSEQLIDDSYILQENEREDRINSFVQKLKETENVSLDFLANVELALRSNKLESDLKEVIQELLEV